MVDSSCLTDFTGRMLSILLRSFIYLEPFRKTNVAWIARSTGKVNSLKAEEG